MVTIAVVGGDRRMLAAAERLSRDFDVRITGFERTDPTEAFDDLCCSRGRAERLEDLGSLEILPLERALKGADALLLPLPAFSGELVSTPFSSSELHIDELLSLMKEHDIKLLCGGMLDKLTAMPNAPEMIFDYYKDESFALLNSIPTAEGAIMTAMQELKITLCGSSSLVIGGGRIGKALALRLDALGSNVTLTARKRADIAAITALGLRAEPTSELGRLVRSRDVIFNTVPHILLEREILEEVSPSTIIIDLASKPGGVDIAAAGRLGLRVIWALSLPGIYSPITAGETIASVVRDRIIKTASEGKCDI